MLAERRSDVAFYYGKKAKEVVIGIRQRGGELRFFHADDAKSGTLAQYIRENISTDVDVIVTDDFAAILWPCARLRCQQTSITWSTTRPSSTLTETSTL